MEVFGCTGQSVDLVDDQIVDGAFLGAAEVHQLFEGGPVDGLGGLSAFFEDFEDVESLSLAVLPAGEPLRAQAHVRDLLYCGDSTIDNGVVWQGELLG